LVTLTAFISPYRRNLRRCSARRVRKARSQGPVQESPRRRAEGIYGH
jgi:hypothetical protein